MISIVITAKDAEVTLAEAVESCLGQEEVTLEVVLVDNGSAQGIETFADPRARQFSCEGSHVEAHQLGISKARGELIARMDADDVSLPGRLAKQQVLLESDLSLAACTCGVRIGSRGRPIGEGFSKYVGWLNSLESAEDIARERFIESPVVHPAAMIRREVLLEVGAYRDVEWAEDYDLWLRVLAAGHRIGMVPEVLFEWFDSDARLTRSNERYSHENFLRAKAHYLAKLGGCFEICGAGPIGKRMGRFLQAEGAEVRAFYEVNPRRIGEAIAGVPVLDQAVMKKHTGVTLLGAVGLDGARDLIRGLAAGVGYVEGRDFFCVA